jgi:hypothetical protein
MKGSQEKGSALILVIIATIILTLMGLNGLRQSTGELTIARNFRYDKTAFFTAESGIHFGINELRETTYPGGIAFESLENGSAYKSGPLAATAPQNIEGFKAFPAPTPKRMSIEVGGALGIVPTAWNLVVSSEYPAGGSHPSKKEISSAILILSAEY